jgi:hypothetical protein
MGYGKKAARNIDQRLMGTYRWDQIAPEIAYGHEVPEQPVECARHESGETPAHERVETFEEVKVGLGAEEVLVEAGRCLRCDVKDHH